MCRSKFILCILSRSLMGLAQDQCEFPLLFDRESSTIYAVWALKSNNLNSKPAKHNYRNLDANSMDSDEAWVTRRHLHQLIEALWKLKQSRNLADNNLDLFSIEGLKFPVPVSKVLHFWGNNKMKRWLMNNTVLI